MFGSLLLWCLLLLPAGWAAWRHRSIGATPARYIPLLIALAFPVLQLARFSEAASEVADRASTFVFMAMALVVAAWLASRLHTMRRLFVPGALLLVLGGTILGSGPDWQRVPGPFLAGAEQRSVDSTTVAVAEWAGTYLPDGSNVAADATFSRVIPNFADITSVTQPAGFESVTPMFISETFDQTSLQLILRNEVDFVVVDTRLVGQIGAVRRVLRGRGRLRRGRCHGHAGDGVQVRGGARLRAGPRRPGQDLRRPLAARRPGAVREPLRSRAARHLDPVAGGRDRGPAPGRHRAAPPPAGPTPLPRRGRVAVRARHPRRDGHRRRRCRPRLRPGRRLRRRGRPAPRPGADQLQPRSAATPTAVAGVVGVGWPDHHPRRGLASRWRSGRRGTGCSTSRRCRRRSSGAAS